MSTVTNRIRAALDSRAMTRVVQLIAFLSLLLSLGVGAKQYALADCLARYNDEAAASQKARAQAAEEDRQAVDTMVKSVVNSHSRAESRAALLAYVNTRAVNDEKRRANPAPVGPSELCR